MKLDIELVPSSSWGNNVRALLSPQQWKILGDIVRDRAWGVCQICGSSEGHLDCHEIWHYNDRNHIQTLEGLQAICEKCHMVKHMGLARVQKKDKQAIAHFMKVNGLSKQKARKLIDKAFQIYSNRCLYSWKLNVSILKRYGIDVTKLELK